MGTMRKSFTCPQGHRWEVAVDEAGGVALGVICCPECGDAAETFVPGLASEPRKDSSASVAATSNIGGQETSVPGNGDQLAHGPEIGAPAETPIDSSVARTEIPNLGPEGGEIPAGLREHPRYRMAACLGAGGMGAVYRAEHRVMRRSVALKIIRPGLLDNAEAVERFRREAEAAARLSHPNIVVAHDAEQAGDVHFLVMEFIDGESLADLVARNGPLPVPEACDCIRQAAQGLQHAHERGMVHRDIKPHNLMRTADGIVKILDFGLARFVRESAPESGITETGAVMGTADYIAPEQTLDAHKADIRADIYSLGCTIYFLLTGEPPFPGGSLGKKLLQHQQSEPTDIRKRRPEVPAPVSAVLKKMMAKLPRERYQTPAQVAEALAPFTRAEILPPRKSSRRLVAAVGSLLAVLFAGAVIWVATDKGELQIITHDQDVKILVSKEGNEVEIVDTRTNASVRLRSGEYGLKLAGGRNDVVIDPERVVLKRGTKVIAEVKKKSASTQPEKKSGPGKSLTADLFQPGSVWRGKFKQFWPRQPGRGSNTYPVVFTVQARVGESFNGRFELIDMRNGQVRDVRGTVSNGAIKWLAKDVKVIRGHHGLDTVGKVVGREIHLGFEGAAVNDGTFTKGTIQLVLAEEGAGRVHTNSLPKYALFCDVGQGIRVPSLDIKYRGPITLEGFFTPLIDSLQKSAHVMGFDYNGIYVRQQQWMFRWTTKTGYEEIGFRFIKGQRTHLAAVFDGRQLRFFVDGKLVGVADSLVVSDRRSADSFTVANSALRCITTEIRVSSVARYDKDFTPKQRVEADADTLALYHFDEGQGNTLKDASGNEHHGMIVGGQGAKWVQADGSPRPISASAIRGRKLFGHPSYVYSVGFSRDSRRAISGGGLRSQDPAKGYYIIRIWDPETGHEVQQLAGHRDRVHAVAFLPDGKVLSGGTDRTLRLWDVASGKVVNSAPTDHLLRLATNAEGTRAILGSFSSHVELWELPALKKLARWDGPKDASFAVGVSLRAGLALAAGGSWLNKAPADADFRVWLYDTATGKPRHHFVGHKSTVNAASFIGPNFMMSSSSDGIRVWDIVGRKELTSLRQPAGLFALFQDRRRAVRTGSDGILRIWEIGSKQELHLLEGYNGRISSLAVSPDGRWVLAGGSELMLWRLPDS